MFRQNDTQSPWPAGAARNWRRGASAGRRGPDRDNDFNMQAECGNIGARRGPGMLAALTAMLWLTGWAGDVLGQVVNFTQANYVVREDAGSIVLQILISGPPAVQGTVQVRATGGGACAHG